MNNEIGINLDHPIYRGGANPHTVEGGLPSTDGDPSNNPNPKRMPNEGGHVGALMNASQKPAPRPMSQSENENAAGYEAATPGGGQRYKGSLANNGVDTSRVAGTPPPSGPQSLGEAASVGFRKLTGH